MATLQQAKAALLKAAKTGRVRNVTVEWTPDRFVFKKEDGHTMACAYGILALNAGLSHEEIENLSDSVDSSGYYGQYFTALHDEVNGIYGIPEDLAQDIEAASDQFGWEAAAECI